jgi:hypothetical protein
MYSVGLAIITLQSSKSSGGPVLGGLLVLLLIVGVVVILGLRARSAENVRAGLLLAHPPAEGIDAVTGYMVQRGFAITYRGDTTATFTRPKKPNMDIGCLLLLLGLVPGLLYFGLFKGTLTTTLRRCATAPRVRISWSREMTSAPEMMLSSGHERIWK